MPEEETYILVVEDDKSQADRIEERLRKAFHSFGIRRVRTESEFRRRLPEFGEHPPALAVIDIMLPWRTINENSKRPDDVRKEGSKSAGFRCEKLLRQEERTARIPVVLYTQLRRTNFEKRLQGVKADRIERGLRPLQYLGKKPTMDGLVTAVKKALGSERLRVDN